MERPCRWSHQGFTGTECSKDRKSDELEGEEANLSTPVSGRRRCQLGNEMSSAKPMVDSKPIPNAAHVKKSYDRLKAILVKSSGSLFAEDLNKFKWTLEWKRLTL